MRDKVYVFVNLHFIDILVYQHIKPPLPPSLKYNTADITHTPSAIPYLWALRTIYIYTYILTDDDMTSMTTTRPTHNIVRV